jgi:hypothetical protein
MSMITITATFEIDEAKYQNELIQQYFVRMMKEKAWEVAIVNHGEVISTTKNALLKLTFVDDVKGELVIFNPDKLHLCDTPKTTNKM